jgi:hypothetical protein
MDSGEIRRRPCGPYGAAIPVGRGGDRAGARYWSIGIYRWDRAHDRPIVGIDGFQPAQADRPGPGCVDEGPACVARHRR